MIVIRKSSDRGRSQIGWLDSYHTFSFAEYYDPQFMGFSHLRVINEDTVQPGYGFAKHPHDNMEIISYIIEGALEHKDSMGTGSVIKPGEIQIMSAGTGIQHSEFNHSKSDRVHFLQIWIIPNKRDLKPRYEQKTITKIYNKLILIASPDQQSDAILIHQNVLLYAAYLTTNSSIKYDFQKKHSGWIQLIKGEIDVNGKPLSFGDGAAIVDEDKIEIKGMQNAELLLFDFSDSPVK